MNVCYQQWIGKTCRTVMVKKCLNKKPCTKFHVFFVVNEHNVNTRNKNILLKMLKVKLEFTKVLFYFMGAKSLPKAIMERDNNFEREVKLFLSDLPPYCSFHLYKILLPSFLMFSTKLVLDCLVMLLFIFPFHLEKFLLLLFLTFLT